MEIFYWGVGLGIFFLMIVGIGLMFNLFYKKVEQSTAIIRTGYGGVKVDFNGIFVLPIFHRFETMDISVKRIEIDRTQQDGLICKDNMRADIKVAFFVRVNKTLEMVMPVCFRGSARRA